MSEDLEKKTYYACLFEYYKNLLTTKQVDIFISYYDEDYSLSEIAESLNISRNAVWDTLKKVTSILDNYEQKLCLYQKDLELSKYLNKLKNHVDDEGLKIINEIEERE